LGEVHEIAEVIVNGKSVRTLWKAPYRVDISDYVIPGDNTLEIKVTSLWPNRLIRDAQLPEEKDSHTLPILSTVPMIRSNLPV
jgi:hypothetical protein